MFEEKCLRSAGLVLTEPVPWMISTMWVNADWRVDTAFLFPAMFPALSFVFSFAFSSSLRSSVDLGLDVVFPMGYGIEGNRCPDWDIN